MKKILSLLLVLVAAVTLVACGNGDDGHPYTDKDGNYIGSETGIKVQGVTPTSITVGNTAAVSGAFAGVGVPFNKGIQAYFKYINDNGGVAGRKINFVTYDDGFDATQGLNYTKQLVETDKVFALVGHFGTPTVGATVNYVQEYGVPMVYAATGINPLYIEKSVGNPLLAVQPIYLTDGRLMTARLLHEKLADGSKLAANAKVGVLHTTTDDGTSISAGIKEEAKQAGRSSNFIYKSFSVEDAAALTAAVIDLKNSGVSAIIIASNQSPMKAALAALEANGLHVPVVTSYVNADASSVDATLNYSFDIYANAWVDATKGITEYMAITEAYEAGLSFGTGYAYVIAGYIAASIFVEGLTRVGTKELTWASYIAALEQAPIEVPMGGQVDFSDGKRWGISTMQLLKLTKAESVYSWAAFLPMESLESIQQK